MTMRLSRPVFVVGVGLHPYQRRTETPYVALGLAAVRGALHDAGVGWRAVESAYTGTALLGMAVSRPMLRHLGASGIPMVQVENASASGSFAVRLAALEVASGAADVVLAMGVDKPGPVPSGASQSGIGDLVGTRVRPMDHFAMLTQRYMADTGIPLADIGAVAVKNHRNGALNVNAQRRKVRTLEEVLAPPTLSGVLTRLQCTPVGEGAAAVLLMSEDGMLRHRVPRSRAVRILASAAASEGPPAGANHDVAVTQQAAMTAFEQAAIGPDELDLVEVHDAFPVEELLYLEAMGVCQPGHAAADVSAGKLDIGGRCAVSASGGLLAMGHPIGPTGVGQIAEITTQLRGEAGRRQHPGARIGLAHMVGVGAVCAVHVLARS